MHYLLLTFISCCLLTSLSLEAGILKQMLGMEYVFNETMFIDIPQQELKQKWKQAHSQSMNDGWAIVEWIPKNQTLDNRNEMITVQFSDHSLSKVKVTSAQQFVNILYNDMQIQYPGMIWNTIEQSENDMLFEWILPNGYKNFPPQHEIVRIICTSKGIHRIAYEKKVSKLDPQTRDLWISRLANAKLVH